MCSLFLCSSFVLVPIRTPKSFEIIRRAEWQLLNDMVGYINNTIKISRIKSYICINQLVYVLDRDTLKDAKTLFTLYTALNGSNCLFLIIFEFKNIHLI